MRVLNGNSVYRQVALPLKGQHFGETGSRSVVVKDLEGGAGSIGATMAHAYWGSNDGE
jgi:hypothetical protein